MPFEEQKVFGRKALTDVGGQVRLRLISTIFSVSVPLTGRVAGRQVGVFL